jgi:hypothetical protein
VLPWKALFCRSALPGFQTPLPTNNKRNSNLLCSHCNMSEMWIITFDKRSLNVTGSLKIFFIKITWFVKWQFLIDQKWRGKQILHQGDTRYATVNTKTSFNLIFPIPSFVHHVLRVIWVVISVSLTQIMSPWPLKQHAPFSPSALCHLLEHYLFWIWSPFILSWERAQNPMEMAEVGKCYDFNLVAFSFWHLPGDHLWIKLIHADALIFIGHVSLDRLWVSYLNWKTCMVDLLAGDLLPMTTTSLNISHFDLLLLPYHIWSVSYPILCIYEAIIMCNPPAFCFPVKRKAIPLDQILPHH